MTNQTPIGNHIYLSAVDRDEHGRRRAYRVAGNPDTSRRFEAAGIVTPTDISDVEAVVIMEEVLGLARPEYNLRQACRVVPMDTLTHKIDVYTKLSASEKVEPLEEPEIQKHGRTRVSFDLWKNVVHVAAEDAAQKRSAHNDLALQIEDAAKALAYSENSQIATVIEAATNTSAGSDWGTVTDGRSANSPYEDIMTAFDTIRGTNGFKPDKILAHPYVWMDFFGNDYVKGQLQGEVLPNLDQAFTVPGLPGMTGISDWALTNTQCLVLDSRNAVVLGEGPTSAEKYRNAAAGYDAYIIRQWLEPQIVQEGAIYKLTAVHA